MDIMVVSFVVALFGVSVALVSAIIKRDVLDVIFLVGVSLWILSAGIHVYLLDYTEEQLAQERAQRYELETTLKACRDKNEDSGLD